MNTALYWFKNDLRLADNPALSAAAGARALLCVYCIDARHEALSAYGPPKLGPHRKAFLRQSLADLAARIATRGSRLLVLAGEAEQILPRLAAGCGADAVVTMAESAPEESGIVRRVVQNLPAGMLICREGGGLYTEAELPFAVATVPRVFTRFRQRVERQAEPAAALLAPAELPPPPTLATDTPSALPTAAQWPATECPFAGGESAGLDRLHDYIWGCRALRHYKATRNRLLGIDYSSKFSPWLALGCLSPRTVLQEVRCFEQTVVRNKSTYWLGFELLWREFFRWTLRAHGRQLFQRQGLLGRLDRPRGCDPTVFAAWREGRTGMPFVDANMRELAATGYMSNRGRQNVASFWARDLAQDWRIGAAWFEAQLVDYDVASNWGNWANVAGVGTDRRDRGFNVLAQAQRYDADAAFVTHWLPELLVLAPVYRHTPFLAPPQDLTRSGYPRLAQPPPHWQPYYPSPAGD